VRGQGGEKKGDGSKCIQPTHSSKCIITAGNIAHAICDATHATGMMRPKGAVCRHGMHRYCAAAQASPHVPSEGRADEWRDACVAGAGDAPAEAPGRRRAHVENRRPHGGRPERQAGARSRPRITGPSGGAVAAGAIDCRRPQAAGIQAARARQTVRRRRVGAEGRAGEDGTDGAWHTRSET
jgi:hypothetical protein